MKSEIRNFTYISNVYKYISNYDLKGHQIGRKIGDMLEILTMGAIYNNKNLRKRLSTEKKLEGYSTAKHKVEFSFFQHDGSEPRLFGAIECKCVGVEETTSGKDNKNLRKLKVGQKFTIEFSGHWQQFPITFIFHLVKIKSSTLAEIRIQAKRENVLILDQSFSFKPQENVKFIMDEKNNCFVVTPKSNMLTEIPSIIRTCKIVRFQNLSDDLATFAMYECLSGPQTIEKAKQASFVAMDLRKKMDGYWGKEEVPIDKKSMTFIHVLCEFCHWEEKSKNVIKTCIDHNLIVPDGIIIKAFQHFEQQFGSEMLNRISKKEFEKNPQVNNAINDILLDCENHLFYDTELQQYVQFHYANNSLNVLPIE